MMDIYRTVPESTSPAQMDRETLTTSDTTISSTQTLATTMLKYDMGVSSTQDVRTVRHIARTTVSSPQAAETDIYESDTTIVFKHVSNKEILNSYTTTNVIRYSFTGCIILVLIVVAFKSGIKRHQLKKHRKSLISRRFQKYSIHRDPYERVEHS
ncbi:hypothetical protein RF11_07692 [Thelohanellus kitauei]|uniref:Uncharacterized protein n=1 Tax=Thelohanellus kitauei TaxID=669202 RepID=A0A0C2MSS1_THEKT|nr:hypothetical protein RF11_07692 [Thelohanellus kitauei]